MPRILPYLLCSALYAVVAVVLARTMSRVDSKAQLENGALHLATALPLALHTALLYASVFAGGQIYLGVGVSISAIIWLTVLIYWAGSFFQRLEGLQVFINAAAAVLVWAPLLLPSVRPLPHTDIPAFGAHVLISLLSYSLFTIASLQALLMAILENRLHEGRLPRYLLSLPPLLTIERLLFRIIATGFVLLTLTLVSGMLFSEMLIGQPLEFNHKVVFGIVSWCIYAALLAGRRIYGWRGPLALRWTLAGFLALLLAYVGTKFVLEIVLQR